MGGKQDHSFSNLRLPKIHQQSRKLQEIGPDFLQHPGDGLVSAKARREKLTSQVIHQLNELFITDERTDKDLVNYAYTKRGI